MILYEKENISIDPVSNENGIEIYKLIGKGKYRWTEELRGVFSTWVPLGGRDHSYRQ